MKSYLLLFLIFSLLLSFSLGEQCGWQAKGALCPNDLCCSKDGWCGNTKPYCDPPGCQSQCTPDDTPPSPSPPPDPSKDLSGIISRTQFYDMLLHMNEDKCPAKGFYTYDAFLTAAKSFPNFGTTGDLATRKKEIAAFFGQTSHETTGGWSKAPDGPNTWGYCYNEKVNCNYTDYCDQSQSFKWPCAPGKSYCGRGPMQLTWNYNYGPCGIALGIDLLNHPELVSQDAVLSFKTAIWFWMTPQFPKLSCHNVITDQWKPSEVDISAGRLPGYGVITNIINGALECAGRSVGDVQDRISFYERYCNDTIFGVNPGSNLDCDKQRPFSDGTGYFSLDAAI